MRNYSAFSIEDLFERYVIYEEEREAIDEHVLALPEPEQSAFIELKKRNAIAIGLEPSPFEEMGEIKLFKTDRQTLEGPSVDFILYDYSLEHYKAYMDDRLALEAENPAVVPYILEDELNRCQQKLEALKQERAGLNSRNAINISIASQQALEECIAYLHGLMARAAKPAMSPKQLPREKNLPRPLPVIVHDLEELKQRAKKYLEHLSGYNRKGRRRLSPKDYERLLEYTDVLIELERTPEGIEPIHKVSETQSHIRYTYYLIHKDLYGNRPKREYFIDFLYAVFPGLFREVEWNTTFTKFSQPPPSYNYDIADR